MTQAITTLRPEDLAAIESGWPVLTGDEGDPQQGLARCEGCGAQLPENAGCQVPGCGDDQEAAADAASPWSPGRVWALLGELIGRGMPPPLSVSVSRSPSGRIGSVDIFAHDRAQVDVWAHYLGVTAALAADLHVRAAGHPWRVYAAELRDPWPGWWDLKVWCTVDEPAAAADGGGA